MADFVYLTFEDILSYYEETIEQSGGGMSGIRERDEILKILEFVQNDLYYPTLEEKLAYMVFSFCTGHYFATANIESCSLRFLASQTNENNLSRKAFTAAMRYKNFTTIMSESDRVMIEANNMHKDLV